MRQDKYSINRKQYATPLGEVDCHSTPRQRVVKIEWVNIALSQRRTRHDLPGVHLAFTIFPPLRAPPSNSKQPKLISSILQSSNLAFFLLTIKLPRRRDNFSS
ncbi:hypothetical protein HJC23_011538 [Cyclotella cryptica]|uniref:Uncharacterized protein n=1 Tax=Cyclotella cryptica TaxID=29204 RepID=A0ABD3NXE8_9STRA